MSGMDGSSSTLVFGERLRQARQAAGLSQEKLAERAGMSAQAIGALERGERQRPYPATLRRLADALELTDDVRAAFLAAPPSRQASMRDGAAESTAADSSPPRSDHANAAAPHAPVAMPALANLPLPLTALLGREQDADRLTAMLCADGVRLLTLTGTGGVGKTRLALHLAHTLRDRFADGVAFVPLAPLADAALVLPTVAQVLGLREGGGAPVGERLQRSLRDKWLLLVLDNCEHVLEGVAAVAALVERCGQLVILATSRAPLRVRGEQEYPLKPLALPDFERMVTVDEAAQSPAVRLFVERAHAASASFTLTLDNASAVAAICGRLDGLPLALELAAPRVKLLPPSALLERLHHTLPLLTAGGRDVPARQQTLRTALDWSYRLLSTQQQRLFARLSVFAGCSLEAMEAVCSAEADLDVLECATSLVEQSLVRAEVGPEDEPRFGMLQTIREYAGAQLEASGEAEESRQRYAAYYLSLAEAAAPNLTGPEQAAWLERLDRDLDNLRAVLGWARERGQTEIGLRLAGGLARFWRERGHGSEGLGWLTEFIARMEATEGGDGVEVPTVVRADALFAAGWLAGGRGEHQLAVPWLERAVALHHVRGDPIGAVRALSALAGVAFDQGDVPGARARYEECAAVARSAQDHGELARALGNLGEMYYHLDDLSRATAFYQESLDVARASGRVEVEAAQLGNLGNVALQQGDLRRAATLHRQALELKWALGYSRQIAITLEDLAALAVVEGRMERAACLLGAAIELRATTDSPQGVPERVATERATAPARAALGEAQWTAAVGAGRVLSLTAAIAYALEAGETAP